MPKLIRIAVPAYDGKIHIELARSLLTEQIMLFNAGIQAEITFLPGSSLITLARDIIADEFLNASKAERLVFIDSDVSFEPGAVLQIVQHDVDFVGGAYRHKSATESYPAVFHLGETTSDARTGLLDVHAVPGGFLALKRNVFWRLKGKHPTRKFKPPFFSREIHSYWWVPPGGGEDGNFCDEWREAGGKVWLDPNLTLTHTGGMPSYTGNIGEWINSKVGGNIDK